MVDPKGYFEYTLGVQGRIISREKLPDYIGVTYTLHTSQPLATGLATPDIPFGQALRLVGQRIQPAQLAAG